MKVELNIPVSNIMSTNLKVLHPKDKILRAKEMFDYFDIHHIPVAVMGEVHGIVSLGDILFLEGVSNNSFDEFLKAKKFEIATIDSIMTSRPYCVDYDDLISVVMDLMIEKRVNSLPVKADGKLVGIVTNFDLLKYFRKGIIDSEMI